jgi:hypothetical protein
MTLRQIMLFVTLLFPAFVVLFIAFCTVGA